MSKTFGEAIYSAFRRDGVLHVTAVGRVPGSETKATLEALPFLIFPPQLGFMFETDGVISPVLLPFEIEKAFPNYPASTKVVSIVDKNGLHSINIEARPATISPLLIADTSEASYIVYQQADTDHYLIAKSDAGVLAIYQAVYGPDAYGHCQAYVASHSIVTPSIDLIPGSLNGWLDKQPNMETGANLIVTVDAYVEVDWTVALSVAVPQGINPLVKLLRLDIQPPTGLVHSNAIAKKTIRYQETPAHSEYTDVTIENGAHTVSAWVKTAS